MVNLHTGAAFKQAMQEVLRDCAITANMLPLAEMMETLHTKPYRTLYPPVHAQGADDDYWHAVRRTWNPDKPPVAHMYDGYAIAFKGMRAIYLAVNGTKRAFPNMDTLNAMGYDLGMLLHFTVKDEEYMGIPDGPDLPPLWYRRLRTRK